MFTDDSQAQSANQSKVANQRLRAIAYSLDCLIPGFYLWLGPIQLRLGGSQPEPDYPGTVHSTAGLAFVLPGYRIFSTYQGNYDP
jgi:hypothetical protein